MRKLDGKVTLFILKVTRITRAGNSNNKQPLTANSELGAVNRSQTSFISTTFNISLNGAGIHAEIDSQLGLALNFAYDIYLNPRIVDNTSH